jgi:uncharacterized protein YcaQ
MRHRLLSRYRVAGLTWPSAPAELILGTGTVAERQRRTAELVESGDLLPVEVDGLKGQRFMPARDRVLLDTAVSEASSTPVDPHVAFIAPLDPLLSDRRLVRDLWQFEYIWEVYVPESKRRWGYYVLPILFGDRIVGRFEPRLDRASRTLRILGMWWEKGFSPRRADGLVAQMRDALRAYMAFVGADRVDWRPATAAAGRLFGTLSRT